MAREIAESLLAAILVAARASARVAVTVAAMAVLPGLCAGIVLAAAGLPVMVAWSPLLGLAVYCLSHFTHELGHTVCATLAAHAIATDPALIAHGTFRRASVTGTSIGRMGDALASLAGPAMGIAPVLALLSPGGPFLIRVPFMVLFLSHLVELRPASADGAGLRGVLIGKDSNAGSQ